MKWEKRTESFWAIAISKRRQSTPSQQESVLNASLVWEIPAGSSFLKVVALSLGIFLFPWS
jgi:hypothetical protein